MKWSSIKNFWKSIIWATLVVMLIKMRLLILPQRSEREWNTTLCLQATGSSDKKTTLDEKKRFPKVCKWRRKRETRNRKRMQFSYVMLPGPLPAYMWSKGVITPKGDGWGGCINLIYYTTLLSPCCPLEPHSHSEFFSSFLKRADLTPCSVPFTHWLETGFFGANVLFFFCFVQNSGRSWQAMDGHLRILCSFFLKTQASAAFSRAYGGGKEGGKQVSSIRVSSSRASLRILHLPFAGIGIKL